MRSITVAGVRVTAASMGELHRAISDLVESKAQGYVLSGNVHGLNMARKYPWLGDFYASADIVRVDGAGVVLGARILGHHIPPRITWADWGWPLAEYLAEQGHSLYLLGGPEGMAEKAAFRLSEHACGLKILGTQHGFFTKTGPENQSVVDAINQAGPDILLVGMGMPLQERWILDNRHQLNPKVIITAGAAFEYLAGTVARCPAWMGNMGLEWLYRFSQAPRRMAKRYLWGNPLFIFRVLLQRFMG